MAGLLRDQIHRDVVTRAFDAERNTFTQAYGTTALDASLQLHGGRAGRSDSMPI